MGGFFILFAFAVAKEFYTFYVYVYGSLYAPSATFMHAAPVFKAFGGKIISGNGGDCFVPVLDFYGVQIDGDDVSIGIEFWHFYPVAYAHGVVAGHLQAGDEAEDGIFKNEQEDGGHGAKDAEEIDGRFSHKD